MTKKYLQLLTLSLIVALSLAFAGMALAQTWQPPQNTTPPECTADDDGCYVPINVSSKDQIKKGFLTLVEGVLLGGNSLSNANLDFVGNGKWIRFAKSADDIEPGVDINDGKIGRLTGSDNLNNRKVLDIIGVRQDLTDTYRSPSVKNRLVRIWDNLTVSGTTTTSNLYAKNYYICNEAGSCTKFEGGGGDSLWENIAGTAKVVLKTLPTPGRVMVGIGNNNPTVDLEVGSPTQATPAYVGVRSATDKYAGYRWANGDKNIWWMYKPANNNTEGVPAESLVLGNTASGGNVATPKVVFTSGAGGANAYVMDVKGSAKATSLSADTIVALNPSPSSNPTNTGLVLANSPVNEDHVLYVQGSPAGGSTLRNVFLKPVSQIGGGVLSQFWNKVSGQEEITYTGRVGVAGANDPSSRVDLAIGSTNGSGLKADNGDISIVTNGSKNLTVSNSANSKFEVGIGTKSSTALSVPGTGIFSNGVSLGGNSAVSSSSDIKFYNADNTVFGRVYGTNSSLSLVGIGSSPNRLIRLYDTASTTNLIANNICTAVGSCTSVSNIVNNTTGFWTEADNRTGLFYPGSIGLKGAENPNSNLAVAIRNNTTGLGSSASNVLDFWTNGAVRLSLSSDGKVQIPAGKQLCLGADCKSSWPVASVASNIWTLITGEARPEAYFDGSIGIAGAGNPNSQIDLAIGKPTTGLKQKTESGTDFLSVFAGGLERIKTGGGKTTHEGSVDLYGNVYIYDKNDRDIRVSIEDGEITTFNLSAWDIGARKVRTSELCLINGCKTAWPTTDGGGGGGTTPGRITCYFDSNGNTSSTGCVNGSVITDTDSEKTYSFACPASYSNIVSGGIDCEATKVQKHAIRESRPQGNGAWVGGCVNTSAVVGWGGATSIRSASIVCQN